MNEDFKEGPRTISYDDYLVLKAECDRRGRLIVALEDKFVKLAAFLRDCLKEDKFSRCVGLNIKARDLRAYLEGKE